ncbi:hypothetical protein A2886_02775 [candidate division WWE3 bacterium RIFCSPHIGHO2_01_FULL_42_13]|uniref:Uncharacterized protein n=1 Tax=candidate division WWE3 bacterium RIFCSPHIGHO2_01_FULL_42_13 TaxID=1802617 RepID=A0A1F4URY6_UNCKA|nr:MAG: hypothetical protein A2886_02775 [candidate division WWE3 bacterium RIFCSPHIGHO2_01_FULL_42_13]
MEVICKSEKDAKELMGLFTTWSSRMGVFLTGPEKTILKPASGSENGFLNFFSNIGTHAPHIQLVKGVEGQYAKP